jgi:hypothetical protein
MNVDGTIISGSPTDVRLIIEWGDPPIIKINLINTGSPTTINANVDIRGMSVIKVTLPAFEALGWVSCPFRDAEWLWS